MTWPATINMKDMHPCYKCGSKIIIDALTGPKRYAYIMRCSDKECGIMGKMLRGTGDAEVDEKMIREYWNHENIHS